jgi:hypothetical protein
LTLPPHTKTTSTRSHKPSYRVGRSLLPSHSLQHTCRAAHCSGVFGCGSCGLPRRPSDERH